MRNKRFAKVSLLLVLSVLIALAAPISAENSNATVDEVQALVDGIVAHKQGSITSIQDWIDGPLTEKAGISSEWYIFALRQSGDYDFSAYETALLSYLKENTVRSAVSRQKYALTLLAIGSDDPYIAETVQNSIGQQGIMSWVFGLFLLQNGCESDSYTAESIKETILSLQFADGGWALNGEQGDIDVTAMTMQALSPYYGKDTDVTAAIDRAVVFLSERQLEHGDYASYGVPNPESTAQVLTTLAALGIDGITDTRFIKNGNTLLDGLTRYQLDDGSFSHKFGDAFNDTATVQALLGLTAYLRMADGEPPLYQLVDRHPQTSTPVATTAAAATTAATTTAATTTSAATVINTTLAANNAQKAAFSYRPTAAAVILGIAILACIVLWLTGKRHRKNFIAVVFIAVLAIVFVYTTDFMSTDTYYNGGTEKENAVGTVTLSIRCDTVAGQKDYIPADGIILDTTPFAIADGDTVYDILMEAARTYELQTESSGAEGMFYMAGIQYLYEFDFGDLSGWIYSVNGTTSSTGCDQYTLQDGDIIEWHYSCDLGNDINK